MTPLPWAVWQEDRVPFLRGLSPISSKEETITGFSVYCRGDFLSPQGNPWITPSGNTSFSKVALPAEGAAGWLFAMTSQSCNLLWSLCSVALITCSLHNSQIDAVWVWKGGYFHEVVFSWKNRGKLLCATAAMALDIEKTTLNDWERCLEYGKGVQGWSTRALISIPSTTITAEQTKHRKISPRDWFLLSFSQSQAVQVGHYW